MHRNSFRSRIIKSNLIISVSIVVLMAVMVSLLAGSLLYQNKKNELQAVTVYAANLIENNASTINDVLFRLQINSSLKANLNTKGDLQLGQSKRIINNLLSSEYLGNKGIRDITIIDTDKNVYSIFYLYNLGSTDLSSAEIFQQCADVSNLWTKDNDLYSLYHIYFDDHPQTKFYVASRIMDYTFNTPLGIVIVTIDENYLQKAVDSRETKEFGTVFYLVSPDKNNVIPLNSGADISSYMEKLRFSETDQDYQTLDNKVITARYLSSMGWYLVSATELNILWVALNRLIFLVVCITLFACILAAVLSGSIMRRLTDGVQEIILAMKKFQQGDFSVQIGSNHSDEIGELSRFLDGMVKKIDVLVEEKCQQAREINRAEFRALQSQINPHFIYNTLDILHWKLLEDCREDLSRSVVSLGNMLRYAMTDSGGLSTLASELENVRNYLDAIYSINEREVALEITVADADKIHLPKLTLQPIVENCVLHGFKSRPANNKIAIDGKYVGSNYHLRILDNGVGFETITESIGLANVKKRIQYMYGPASGLHIQSVPGQGTVVDIYFHIQ